MAASAASAVIGPRVAGTCSFSVENEHLSFSFLFFSVFLLFAVAPGRHPVDVHTVYTGKQQTEKEKRREKRREPFPLGFCFLSRSLWLSLYKRRVYK
jgi:hypothetical protein